MLPRKPRQICIQRTDTLRNRQDQVVGLRLSSAETENAGVSKEQLVPTDASVHTLVQSGSSGFVPEFLDQGKIMKNLQRHTLTG